MNIAFILPDLRGGGAEKVCINLATNWISKGHSVTFVLMNKRGEYLKNVPKKIKIISLKKKKIRQLFFPLFNFFKSHRPDITLAQMWPLTSITVLSWLLSFKIGKLFLVDHVHLSTSVEKEILFPKKIFKLIVKTTYLFADKIVVVSNGVKKDLVEISSNLKNKIEVIYNPLVKKKIFNFKKDLYWKQKIWGNNTENCILSIGSLKLQKDHINLITAFSLLKSYQKFKLIIVGNGPLRKELKLLVRNKRLTNFIHFVGFKTNLTQYYQTADLFVSSSKWEGFSNVIVEALSYGLPVVSTDCKSGPSEILKKGKFGILVPVEDSKKLSAAINKSLKIKHNRKLLIKRSLDFEISKISNQYLRLINYEK